MASTKFTRDEAILALDVLYSAENKRVSADSPEMIELSELLKRLPIHSVDNRRTDFRCATGVTQQLRLFKTSCNTGKNNPNVGNIFFEIAFEYEGREEELHRIANAIRKNESFYFSLYGSIVENCGFSEGILLGHLHRLIENRDGSKFQGNTCCDICNLKPDLYYRSCNTILRQHLIINPAEMDWNKKYSSNFFITVCPNCHEVLHRSRPWLTKNNLGELLR